MAEKPFVINSKQVLDHIDQMKPVYVYRNLHKNCFSVRQLGIVKCHTSRILLNDCTFVVNQKGRDRVRDERKKNVHAFVKGVVVPASKIRDLLPFSWTDCYYNPYTVDHWVEMPKAKQGQTVKVENRPVKSAEYAELSCDSVDCGVKAYNLLYL